MPQSVSSARAFHGEGDLASAFLEKRPERLQPMGDDRQEEALEPQGPNGDGAGAKSPEAASEANRYTSIPLSSLRMDTVTGFNLYMKVGKDKYVLYRGVDLKFTEEHKAKLHQSKVRRLYISASERSHYLRYLEGNLAGIINDSALPDGQKAQILYDSATHMIEDVFDKPTVGENIERSHDLVDVTVRHLLKGPASLTSMLNSMSFDYRVYSHSVNVCVFGIALGRRIGLSAAELNQLGAGLLLHDVGKSVIDPAILKKEGPLTDEEWAIIKTHPERGVELLKDSNGMAPASLSVVLQHHEKCSGEGYPHGLREEEIHLYAKIAALADVFDALTTDRPYGQASDSFPAIRIMQSEMAGAFSERLLRELILMMTGSNLEVPAAGSPVDSTSKKNLRASG